MLLLKDSLELPAPQHYKYITSISKNVYIDKLDDIVYKHNNTYHNKIKIKSFDVKLSKYIDSSKEISDKDPKFKVDDIVRISKWKNIFAKGYVPNRSEKLFFIKKVKKNAPWTYVNSDLKGKDNVGTFHEKQLQKTNQKEFRAEKAIKRKGDKLYVKWKHHDSSLKQLD